MQEVAFLRQLIGEIIGERHQQHVHQQQHITQREYIDTGRVSGDNDSVNVSTHPHHPYQYPMDASCLDDVSSSVSTPSLTSPPSVLYIDNRSAESLTTNGGTSGRTKHNDIRHHFVRDFVDRGDAIIEWVRSKDQYADILTKALARPKFERARSMIHNMCDIE